VISPGRSAAGGASGPAADSSVRRPADGPGSRGPQGADPDAAGTAGLRSALRSALARELEDAARLRHELHAHPEVSGSEDRTAARVAAALGAPGAPAVAGTGRLVRIGAAAGPCVAIRAELDALPITEQTGAAWSSQTGAMHACGHDVHLAALVALGRAASTTDLPAALLAVLQPREEAPPSGARDIVSAESFAAQQPRAIIGVHLQPQLPARTAAAPAGAVNASSDDFEIVVEGLGGHAGYPHLAVDPVPALCQIVLALQQIVSRRTDPTHAAAVSVGMLTAGQAPNIIPGTARARGTLRALEPADRPAIRAALREIVEHASLAHGCRATVTIHEGEPALINDEDLTAGSWPWLRQAGFAVDTSFRSCGADDFAFYTRSAPSVMIFVGTDSPVSLHHPGFLPPDEAIGQVAEAMLAGYLAALSLRLAPPARAEACAVHRAGTRCRDTQGPAPHDRSA
jgi:amidohydrolase